MRMKKLLCLLLSVLMLVSLSAVALAAPEAETAAPEEPTPREAVPAAPDEGAPDAPEERVYPEEPILIGDEEPDGAGLMASGSLTLTVNFPAGVKAPAGSRIYVSIASEAEISASGEITKNPTTYYGRTSDVEEGATSFTVTTSNLPTGKYVFSVRPYIAAAGIVSGYYYFNGDGTVADSQYTAKGMSITDGGSASKTITLPKAPHSISGTLTFSSPVAASQSLEIEVGPGGSGSWLYSYILIPSGATSVPFAVGTEYDSACLEFIGIKDFYYAIDNTLTDEYDYRCYFDLSSGDVTGLTVNGDKLLGEVEAQESVRVTVNITLPEAAKKETTYRVVLDSDSRRTSTSRSVAAGATSFTVTLPVTTGMDYRISYLEAGGYGVSLNDSLPGLRYAGESGVVSKNAAKLFRFTEDTTVDIKEGAFWKITGSMTRAAGYQGDTGLAFVSADFADGSTWGTYVGFDSGETTGSYTIYVPRTQKGGFTLRGAYSASGTTLYAYNLQWLTGADYPALTGDLAASTIALPAPGAITGTVTLSGFKAPEGGLALRVYSTSNSSIQKYYVIPAGKSSVSFSIPSFASGEQTIYVGFESRDKTLPSSIRTSVTADESGNASGAAVTVSKAVAISGTISLPDGVTDAGASMQVYGSLSGSSCYSYVSIREGGGSTANYTLYAPDGTAFTSFYLDVRGTTSDYIDDGNLYLDGDWKPCDTRTPVTVSGSKSHVDFTLKKAILVTGTFAAEDGSAVKLDAEDSLYMYFATEKNGSYTSSRMKVSEDGSWSVKTPSGMTGDLYLRAYINESPNTNVLSGYYYYSAGSEALRGYNAYENAEPVTVTASGASGVRIVVATGCRISGNVKLPEGGYVNVNQGYNPSFSVSAVRSDNTESFSGRFSPVSGETSFPYSILVPKEAETYTIRFYGSSWNANYGTTNIVFSASVTADGEVSVSSGDVTGPDLTLPLSKAAITGTVTRPAGVTSYISGTVYVTTFNDAADTETNRYSTSFNISSGVSSTTYSINIPDTDPGTAYSVHYYTYTDGLSRYGYVTEDGLSTKSDDEASFPFASGSHNHSFTLLEVPVIVSGRVYFPADMTETFRVNIYAYNSTNLYIDPASCATAANGLKYAEYKIGNSYGNSNFNYYMSFSVTDESGTLYSGRTFYIDSDGGLTFNYSEAQYFSYKGDPMQQDITLIRWDEGSDDFLIQSEHGVKNDGDDIIYTYTYTYPGECTSLTLHTSPLGDASYYVTVKGSGTSYSNYLYPGQNVTVSGNTFTITYKLTNTYGSYKYGFAVDSITPNTPTETNVDLASVSVGGGSGDSALLDAVKSGEALKSIVVGPEGTTAEVFAGVYDADGKMLDVTLVTADLKPEGVSMNIRFDGEMSDAASLRLFIADTDGRPLADAHRFGA